MVGENKGQKVRKGPSVYSVLFTDARGTRCLSRYFSTEQAARKWKRFLEETGYTSVDVQKVR